jgi:putative membrane protein
MKGNIAVSFSTGGIVLGVGNIMRIAIASNDNITSTLAWGGIGAALLLIVYLGFELLTPKLNVSEEIGKGNKAVGFLSFVFSLAFSFIIGASIS